MKMCVTGGAGFIGSSLAGKLLDSGNEVIVVDNLKTGRIENIREFETHPNFSFFNASILDNSIYEILEDVDCVFHNAALVDVKESLKDPESTQIVNVDGTRNVLDGCVWNDVKKIIFASSCAVYSEDEVPSKEDGKTSPGSPYAESKLSGEKLVREYSDRGLKYTILRYFNVYGPRQNMNSQYSAVIPSFISNALKGEPLRIHGDGNQTRDFVFVRDVVDANMLSMRVNADNRIFNIGSGTGVTVNDLAEMIVRLARSESPVEHADSDDTGIRHSMADISSSRNVLGYGPKYPLEKGLAETVEWFSR